MYKRLNFKEYQNIMKRYPNAKVIKFIRVTDREVTLYIEP